MKDLEKKEAGMHALTKYVTYIEVLRQLQKSEKPIDLFGSSQLRPVRRIVENEIFYFDFVQEQKNLGRIIIKINDNANLKINSSIKMRMIPDRIKQIVAERACNLVGFKI